MSSWNIPQPGQNGIDFEKPVVVFQSDVDFNAVYTSMQAQELAKQVHAAVALGWSLSELLGRCFLLQDISSSSSVTWNGAQLVALTEAETPREKVRTHMEHILFLADILNVRAIPIDSDVAPAQGATYADVLSELVKKLCADRFDANQEETQQSVLGSINERIFFWDLKIQDALQNYPMVMHKAYLVGQSLAGLRWYFRSVQSELDQGTLDKICHEYIPLLGPYLPLFATGALSNSVEVWGKVAIAGQKLQNNTSYSPNQLNIQAHIWYDILTGSRNPLSYVDTSTHGARYFWRVARVAWPLLLIPLLTIFLIAVVALVVIFANIDQVIKEVTAIAGLLALVGTSHSTTSNMSGIVEKALSHTGGAIKGSYIESVWHSTQQKAVNKATCIPPLLLTQATGQPLTEHQTVKNA